MDFGQAIKAAKEGNRISREGWNGKHQYVELATCVSYRNAAGDTVNVNHDNIGNAALAFVGTSGVQLGWLASQADMLADDWVVKDETADLPDSRSAMTREIPDGILNAFRVIPKEAIQKMNCALTINNNHPVIHS